MVELGQGHDRGRYRSGAGRRPRVELVDDVSVEDVARPGSFKFGDHGLVPASHVVQHLVELVGGGLVRIHHRFDPGARTAQTDDVVRLSRDLVRADPCK